MSNFYGGKDLDRAAGCFLLIAALLLIAGGAGVAVFIVWLCGGFQ